MQLSTRGRYAVMAMVELAGRDGGAPVTLADIAGCQQLSLSYLEQLFGGLRRAGLVTSARGPAGGYRLARSAATISIADIILGADEPIRATRCATGDVGCQRGPHGGQQPCHTHDLWAELGRQIDVFLTAITLADVIEGRVKGRAFGEPGGGPGGGA